ncbi:MAG: hypothetical protein ABSE55_06185 [Terracidiphilus sp.]|jgi:hypothetical protein
MDYKDEILKDLERQDIHRVYLHGMPEDLERQIKALCIEYMGAVVDGQRAMRSAITRKAGWFILNFAFKMATLAMQHKDKEALALGIIALHLSEILNVDCRDAVDLIAKLAYAAQQCELVPAEYTMLVCPDFPPKFLEWFRKPGPVKVGPDADGNLVFQITDEALARKARWKENLDARRKKKIIPEAIQK